MSNSTARPWMMFLPLAAVLLLALLWTVYWALASAIAQSRLEEEKSRFAAQGLTLACASEDWGGYPFHFEFTCSSPVLALGDRLQIKSSELLLAALAYAPWQIVILLDGPSIITGFGDQVRTAKHQRAIAAITLDSDWRVKLSAEVPDLSVQDHGAAARVMMHTRPSAEGLIDVAISVQDVSIQVPDRPDLSIADGELLATLITDKSLRIGRISLQQGILRYWGTGTVALDSSNRLSGKLDTQTNDLDSLLSFIDPYLQLTEDKKVGFRSVLGLLGNEARAPLIARDGVLYLGPFKITDLRPFY